MAKPPNLRQLTLLAPGLLDSTHVIPHEKRALERLLSRADVQSVPTTDYYALLMRCSGYPLVEGAASSLAALSHLVDTGVADDAHWLRADPVYGYADKDRVLLMAHEGLALQVSEAQELVELLNAHLQIDGLRLELVHPHRWYIRLDHDPQIVTTSLAQVLGKDMHQGVLRGEQARYWRRLLNELQMLLHDCPLNRARQARGALPVNSVWFWGEGRLPAPFITPWAQVWSDDPVALGMAKLCGVARRGAPSNLETWLRDAITPGHHLVTLLPYGDQPGFVFEGDEARARMTGFEMLLKALRGGDIEQLTLWPGGSRLFQLRRPQAWRFWRSPHSIEYFK